MQRVICSRSKARESMTSRKKSPQTLPRALVTGGAGFIGSHVADLLIGKGFQVDIVDNLATGKRENIPHKASFHEMGVNTPEFARLVREGQFDVVIHLAGQIDVRKSVADPINDATINILGTLNLMEAVRAGSPKTRVVFTSTGGVLYGDFNTPPNAEIYPKDPESPYAIAKLSIEYYLAYYGRVHSLDTVALRFGNVYGPRQDPHGEAGVVAIFCGRILDNRPLTVFGDGLQTRDYIYVGDVANATFAAATRGLPPMERLDARGFNIATGVGTPVIDVAQTLLRVSDASLPIEYAPLRPGEQQHSFLDVSKAASLLGWKPTLT